MEIIILILLSILSGILGRMGGAGKSGQWYDKILNTRWRDAGCGFCVILAWILLFGFNLNYWYIYIIVFGLQWGAFTTYWDKLFKFDNLGFSGFIVGLAALPLSIIQHDSLVWLIVRAFILGGIWFVLNKYLPPKVFIWRHDVAEEFLRYKSVII